VAAGLREAALSGDRAALSVLLELRQVLPPRIATLSPFIAYTSAVSWTSRRGLLPQLRPCRVPHGASLVDHLYHCRRVDTGGDGDLEPLQDRAPRSGPVLSCFDRMSGLKVARSAEEFTGPAPRSIAYAASRSVTMAVPTSM
jgi:hypothetical protein